jgi:four helix bundle protein
MKRSHHDLQVWQEGMALAKEIYSVTKSFPKEEIFGLTSQMRRASVSIPSNLAEGAARSSNKEFLQFCIIARGSLMELETQVLLSKEFGYIENPNNLLEKLNKVFALLNGLITNLRRKTTK